MATNKTITVTTVSTVTGDTLASYNAYSDQDGLLGSLSVAEAAAGKVFALSDGVTHSVTVKPVGTTNGEFSAVISNAVTVDLSSSYLLSDDFTGTSFDVAKWTVTEGNTSESTVSQNNELRIDVADSAPNGFGYDDHIETVDVGNQTNIYVKFDLTCNNLAVSQMQYQIKLNNAAKDSETESLGIIKTDATYVKNMCRTAGATDIGTGSNIDISSATSFKFSKTGTVGRIYYWTGSWTQLGSDHVLTSSWGNMYLLVMARNNNGSTTSGRLTMDNLYITDTDFTSQNP